MTNIQAINLLKSFEQCLDDYCELSYEGKTAFGMAITALELFGNSEQLPSTQPESNREWYMHGYRDAQRWIPVTERMPEEHEWIGTKKFGTTISNEVYVTFETPDGERFAKHISFQNGKLSSVDEQHMKVWYKGAKPVAWMPLPEAYKETENDEQ